MQLVPVILSGGSGTRLWPMSRKLLPKQFLPLVTERTMLQETAARLQGLPQCEAPVLVVNNDHRFLAAEQMHAIGMAPKATILEPVGRNTAPAIAAAALVVARTDPEALLFVLPADHAIGNLAGFHAAIAKAREAAAKGCMVTFAIQPSAPATGYGYIEIGDPLAEDAEVRRIRRFVEKPDAQTARQFLETGSFYWNSGMFVFGAARFLEELRAHRPDILSAVERSVDAAVQDLDFVRLDTAAFTACPSEAVDRAVMERTSQGAAVRGEFGWSDVGAWSTLWEITRKDARGNVIYGDVAPADASNCYVRASSRHVSLIGIKDLVIVETDDAVLIAAMERAQEVKDAVEALAKQSRTEHVTHRRVYRPWGYYESIDNGERFQVKRLMVKPGQALSLQRHQKRAEHWVVVKGRARVTRDEDLIHINENQSTYIPLGVKHRLENVGTEPLIIVEVQSGSYLGEDDIERFEDRYNRA